MDLNFRRRARERRIAAEVASDVDSGKWKVERDAEWSD
jgi:hypothetical protein